RRNYTLASPVKRGLRWTTYVDGAIMTTNTASSGHTPTTKRPLHPIIHKIIGKKLDVDRRLDGSDLPEAVRSKIEMRSRWVMILDNADDLGLFRVSRAQHENRKDLGNYVPKAITLVGARRSVEVQYIAKDEATLLLSRVRDNESTPEEAGVDAVFWTRSLASDGRS
ncbi:unnamed protein product, partial [Clonostachys rhizophaga]